MFTHANLSKLPTKKLWKLAGYFGIMLDKRAKKDDIIHAILNNISINETVMDVDEYVAKCLLDPNNQKSARVLRIEYYSQHKGDK